MKTHTARVHRGRATEIVLGEGRVVAAISVDYHGMPAISFMPSPKSGVVGNDFLPEEQMQLREGSVIIAFANLDAIERQIQRLQELVTLVQSQGAGQGGADV